MKVKVLLTASAVLLVTVLSCDAFILKGHGMNSAGPKEKGGQGFQDVFGYDELSINCESEKIMKTKKNCLLSAKLSVRKLCF